MAYFKYCMLLCSMSVCFYVKSDKCNRPKWHVIGIYSACYNQTNRTELNHLAEDLDKTVEYLWKQRTHRKFTLYMKPIVCSKKGFGFINVTYISMDICNDFNRLPEIVESIYLEKIFHYESWSDKRNRSYSLSTVIAIYADVPSEMMSYLEASFQGDIRFAGKYMAYSRMDDVIENYKMYANILHYIITHRLKWKRLLILNVQPSTMTPVYEFLKQKSMESKKCAQFKEVDSSWNLSQEDYFTPKWFRDNRPAVITIGDKYGQVEVIKQLGKFIKDENITIPILAEGFKIIISGWQKAPKSFDCFKVFTSSFLTTDFRAFEIMELDNIVTNSKSLFQAISNVVNRSISYTQGRILYYTLGLDRIFADNGRFCICPLNFDGMEGQISMGINFFNKIIRKQINFLVEPHNEYNMVDALILDPKLPIKRSIFGFYCRRSRLREQYYEDISPGNNYHRNKCSYDYANDRRCWKGKSKLP